MCAVIVRMPDAHRFIFAAEQISSVPLMFIIGKILAPVIVHFTCGHMTRCNIFAAGVCRPSVFTVWSCMGKLYCDFNRSLHCDFFKSVIIFQFIKAFAFGNGFIIIIPVPCIITCSEFVNHIKNCACFGLIELCIYRYCVSVIGNGRKVCTN